MEFCRLEKNHNKKTFNSGEPLVDEWLKTKARQSQDKRLSITNVLIDEKEIKGFYTIAIGQISLEDLSDQEFKKLPKGLVPIVTLAWLGLDKSLHGKGYGDKLFIHSLVHCYKTGLRFPFVALILDCLSNDAKSFYQRYDFKELPGHPLKLFISWKTLKTIAEV